MNGTVLVVLDLDHSLIAPYDVDDLQIPWIGGERGIEYVKQRLTKIKETNEQHGIKTRFAIVTARAFPTADTYFIMESLLPFLDNDITFSHRNGAHFFIAGQNVDGEPEYFLYHFSSGRGALTKEATDLAGCTPHIVFWPGQKSEAITRIANASHVPFNQIFVIDDAQAVHRDVRRFGMNVASTASFLPVRGSIDDLGSFQQVLPRLTSVYNDLASQITFLRQHLTDKKAKRFIISFDEKPATSKIVTSFFQQLMRSGVLQASDISTKGMLNATKTTLDSEGTSALLSQLEPGIFYDEAIYLISATGNQYVVFKEPDTELAESRFVYRDDKATGCKYYLVQNTTDASDWKMIRVSMSHDKNQLCLNEETLLDGMDNAECFTEEELEYRLLPLQALPFNQYHQPSLPVDSQDPLPKFTFIQKALEAYESFGDSAGIPTLEWTDKGLRQTFLKKETSEAVSPDVKTCTREQRKEKLYRLINDIVYIATGSPMERLDKTLLLNNRMAKGTTIASRERWGNISTIPLCPFYQQVNFVNFILDLEKVAQHEKLGDDAFNPFDEMRKVIISHQEAALAQHSAINHSSGSELLGQVNVWEATFLQELQCFQKLCTDSFLKPSPEDFDQTFMRTRILCRCLTEESFLSDQRLDTMLLPIPFSEDQVALIKKRITAWRRLDAKLDVSDLWQEALYLANNEQEAKFLRTLISWRVPGLATARVLDKGPGDNASILHAFINKQIRDGAYQPNSWALAMVCELLLAGADPYMPKDDGWTVLYDLVRYGQKVFDITHALTDAGVSPFFYQTTKDLEERPYDCLDKLTGDYLTKISFLMGMPPPTEEEQEKISRLLDESRQLRMYAALQHNLKVHAENNLSSKDLFLTEEVKPRIVYRPTQMMHDFLSALQQTLSHPKEVIEKPVFPGYEILDRASEQDGWSCFDIAVGVSREEIVDYALDNMRYRDLRELVAPEIMSAILLTYAYLQEGATPVTQQHQTLPLSMRTEEMQRLARACLDIEAALKPRLQECNTLLQRVEGSRLNWFELSSYFEQVVDGIPNAERYAPAYEVYLSSIRELEAPKESLYQYASRADIYEQYINDYYGKKQWFAFAGVDSQTSMIDLVARMKKAQIIIHLSDERLYKTTAYGDTTIHIGYCNGNHFVRLEAIDALLAEPPTPTTVTSSALSSEAGFFVQRPVTAPNLVDAATQTTELELR